MASRKKTKNKVNFNNLLILLVLISSGFLIYHILLLGPIEPRIRYIIIGVIVFINIVFFAVKQNKKKKIANIMMILFIRYNTGWASPNTFQRTNSSTIFPKMRILPCAHLKWPIICFSCFHKDYYLIGNII